MADYHRFSKARLIAELNRLQVHARADDPQTRRLHQDLQVHQIARYSEFNLFDRTPGLGLADCIECGLCATVCPSRRPLLSGCTRSPWQTDCSPLRCGTWDLGRMLGLHTVRVVASVAPSSS